ncbi:MAG: hypothetical protein Q8K75_05775 [Chlamydiales bacterium]|nr:hypothetical protein [Chlamydiales bacterium]
MKTMSIVFVLLAVSFVANAQAQPNATIQSATSYDIFHDTMYSWANGASGAEAVRRHAFRSFWSFSSFSPFVEKKLLVLSSIPLRQG